MSLFPDKTGTVASLGGMLSLGIGGVITTLITRLHIVSQLPLSCVLLALALLSLASLCLIKLK